jgi:Arc/MetJ family transcription regulator
VPRPASGRVRKNYRLDPQLIARAQSILGTATETETIEQALDLVAFRRDVLDGVRREAGANVWVDAIADEATSPPGVGKGILKLAGTVPPSDADAMLTAIEAACERVDESAW